MKKFSCFKVHPNKEINGLTDIFHWLDNIWDDADNLTDEELVKKLDEVTDYCMGGKDGKQCYFISYERGERLMKKRVQKYCRKHKIKLKDYDGILPWRMYIIESFKPTENGNKN